MTKPKGSNIKHLQIIGKDYYKGEQYKKGSASIEIKMIIDDASKVSPFTKMFTLDEFRDMDYEVLEDIILDTTKHIAKTYALALRNREDCLNAKD